jgi:hypothetical protein
MTGMPSGLAQVDPNNFYGQTKVAIDPKTKGPKYPMPDAFGSEVFIDGRTDVALDARSLAAQALTQKEENKQKQAEIDRSIRADIATGQPITVLIAPEHFVQLTFMRDNEIVYPKRAFAGQPELLQIDKKEGSPYVYIEATAMVEGQTTNLFVETEEDGKIQTYVVNLLVTEPKNIREQVSVNLVEDKTPPIRGGEGSQQDWEKKEGYAQNGTSAGGKSGTSLGQGTSATKGVGTAVAGKFTEDDTKKYLNTMIEMAEHFPQAKQLERKTGRIVYREADLRVYPSGKNNYSDPVEGTIWNVNQVYFFPKYDAILLDVRCKNPKNIESSWDFSQTKWQANNSPSYFSTTAAAPISMITPANGNNQIWYLIQGNRLDPSAEFSPVFPRPDRRGKGAELKPVATRSTK